MLVIRSYSLDDVGETIVTDCGLPPALWVGEHIEDLEDIFGTVSAINLYKAAADPYCAYEDVENSNTLSDSGSSFATLSSDEWDSWGHSDKTLRNETAASKAGLSSRMTPCPTLMCFISQLYLVVVNSRRFHTQKKWNSLNMILLTFSWVRKFHRRILMFTCHQVQTYFDKFHFLLPVVDKLSFLQRYRLFTDLSTARP